MTEIISRDEILELEAKRKEERRKKLLERLEGRHVWKNMRNPDEILSEVSGHVEEAQEDELFYAKQNLAELQAKIDALSTTLGKGDE